MNKLPMGWVEAQLGEFIEFAIGGDWGKDTDFCDDNFTEVFCIRGAEFRNWEKEKGLTASPRKIKLSSLKTRQLQENDILVEISGGSPEQPVGRTVLIEPDVFKNIGSDKVVCTNFIRLTRPFNHINAKYLNYYLNLFYKSHEINNYQSGSNNLRNLKFDDYLTISIPTAPKAEQDHIAELLDTYLSQVAQIKERLNSILPLLKTFRQSVLAQAVSGKLLDGLNFKNWEKTTLGQIARWSSGGTPSRKNPDYYNGNIPWIKTGDLGEKYITQTSEHITDEAIKNSSAKLFPKGSVALAMYGATIGKTSILGIDATTNQACAVALPNKETDTEFLYYLLLNEKDNFIAKAKGGAQPNISQMIIKDHEIYLPPLAEQQQIVAKVEQLFTFADKIEADVQTALERVSHLTQSILHQAFIGNLSADWRKHHPKLITGEHDATALLDRIHADTSAKPTRTKTRKKADT